MKTKFEIISEIANLKYPSNVWQRSLEISRIERCGYTKKELLEVFKNDIRQIKLNQVGIR